MENFIVAALQFSILEGDPESNIRKVDSLGNSLDTSIPKLVVLPEMWPYGFDYARLHEHALEAPQILKRMVKWALNWNAIVVGSIAELIEDGKIVNRAYVIDSSGEILGFYDKIHLFSPHGEHLYFTRGSHILIVNTSLCRIGVIVCYDLRFPELARRIAIEGADILCVPALWPSVRVEHWRLLLRARAVENQMFVVGCNGCGETGNTAYPGASAVIDPWGEVLQQGDNAEGVISAMVSIKAIENARARIPCFTDRVDPMNLKIFRRPDFTLTQV